MTDVEENIKAEENNFCYLCGEKGDVLYKDLHDTLFGAKGHWGLKRCSNKSCSLIWVDPMPSPKEIKKLYVDYYTHTDHSAKITTIIKESSILKAYHYVKDGYLAWRFGYYTSYSTMQKIMGLSLYLLPRRRSIIDRSILWLRANNGGRLLDLGCGNGKFLESLPSGWQLEGVEVDADAVEIATSRGLKVRLGSLEEQQYPDNIFDVITMNHVIEHIHDPLLLFKECQRILKPHGKLVLITPNSESLGQRIFKHNWRGLEVPRHLYIFSCKALRTLARKAGFQGIDLASTGLFAEKYYITSRAIATGKGYIPPYYKGTIMERLTAAGYYFLEKLLMIFNSDLGEEIFLVATK